MGGIIFGLLCFALVVCLESGEAGAFFFLLGIIYLMLVV